MHALIDVNTVSDLGRRHDFGADPIPDLTHKTPEVRWIPVIAAGPRPQPADPSTHHVDRAADVVTLTEITESWEEVAYTAQELADRAAAAAQHEADILAELDTEPDLPIAQGGALSVRTRALIELFNKRDNYLTNRIEELQNALIALQASAGNAGARLDALPATYLATNTRTKAAAIADYKADLPNQTT